MGNKVLGMTTKQDAYACLPDKGVTVFTPFGPTACGSRSIYITRSGHAVVRMVNGDTVTLTKLRKGVMLPLRILSFIRGSARFVAMF